MDLITTTADLAAACERLARHQIITVDTEFLRETTYYPLLCVVQMASEDEAVVIDVTGLREETWLDRAGDFHSDKLHVVERYTPMSPYHMTYEATLDDPKVYTRPWKISFPLYRRLEKNLQLVEFKCVPFTEELLYGRFRKPGAK